MNKFFNYSICVLLLALSIITFAQGQQPSTVQNWAILVAGSNEYYNYRHQADICHAYQIVKDHGIPESNIITMMYNDIAYNDQNPTPGTIINEPNGPNVYPGKSAIDYTGDDVTPENFLSIIKGEAMNNTGSGKTLRSGSNDRVFIYFADHGAPNLIAFPGFKMLHANELMSALKHMYQNSMYSELVLYVEACESGSMFNNILSSNLNIYAETAANPYQSSYACDHSTKYNTYLNDCYSINWMNDTDHSNLKNKTIGEQYDIVKQLTTESNVCEYGDLSLKDSLLIKFQGAESSKRHAMKQTEEKKPKKMPVLSRDVKEIYLKSRLEQTSGAEREAVQKEINQYMKEKTIADTVFGAISNHFSLHRIREERARQNDEDHCHSKTLPDPVCMQNSVKAMEKYCGKFNEYSLRYASYLRDACEAGVSSRSMALKLREVCSVIAQ